MRGAIAVWSIALFGTPVQAVDVDGVYKLTADASCNLIGEVGGALMIRDDVLHGIGSQCRMMNRLPVRNMEADLVDMRCVGEGTEWAERALVMRGAEGDLILVWNGYAFTYPRCTDVGPFLPNTRPKPRP